MSQNRLLKCAARLAAGNAYRAALVSKRFLEVSRLSLVEEVFHRAQKLCQVNV